VDSAVLVERLRAGDESAFDEVYASQRAALFSYLARVTRRRALAEELLQETWLRFARHARSFEPGTDLRAWLFTVARNLYRSQRRTAQVARDYLEALEVLPTRVHSSPFEDALASETERRLEAALGALPLEARELILLSAVEQLTPTQVAQVLRIRPEAARQRLSRARARLSALLEASSVIPVGEAS
jgi:RNA polymerase sigma-70 factor (ECF subfamily)